MAGAGPKRRSFVSKFDWYHRKNPRRQRSAETTKEGGHEVSCMQKCSPASHNCWNVVTPGFSWAKIPAVHFVITQWQERSVRAARELTSPVGSDLSLGAAKSQLESKRNTCCQH